MNMVDAWGPAEDSILKVWDLLSLCLSVSESGCIPFYSTSFSHENSRADYLPCPVNCLQLVQNQRRVTARGSLLFGKRGKSDDAPRNLWNCPIRRTGTDQFLPILGRCHPLESFNSNCIIGIGGGKHINSLQSLDDVMPWSPSTIR
ncbi:hypothetical protein TNCV_2560561 [Trichonephila clavipes]|uniref:Uncharacterized protein n=1 Tax=Trichonephila clavipes TaxID=2585209 RepID=A0A8X6UY51_TRICX|nr:hypothetical protein TNCV_2560561 [Trichonephila clavipes]